MKQRFTLGVTLASALAIVGASAALAQDGTDVGNPDHLSTDGVALEIHEDVEPTLGDNELCGANAIMAVMRGAAPVDLSGNTRCDGAPLLFE